MELPQQYPYNPKWQAVGFGVLLFGGGFWLMAHEANHSNEGWSLITVTLGSTGASFFYWVVAALSAVFAVFSLFLAVRLFTTYQVLELGQDTLVLPQGFFKTQYIQIPYSEIERIWEVEVSGQAFLCITTGGRKFKITASQLPDKDSYIAIKDFLYSQAQHHDSEQA